MKNFEAAEITELNLSETANGFLPGWREATICGTRIGHNDILAHLGCGCGDKSTDNGNGSGDGYEQGSEVVDSTSN